MGGQVWWKWRFSLCFSVCSVVKTVHSNESWFNTMKRSENNPPGASSPFDFDMLHEVDTVISAFENAGIRYALAGGFAVAVYGQIRATKDVDFLCHPEDLDRADVCLADSGYKTFTEPWTFKNTAMALHRYMKPSREPELFHVVDILVPPADRLYWIADAIKISWGQQDKVAVVSRTNLVEMKKRRGSTLDQGDIDYLEGRI